MEYISMDKKVDQIESEVATCKGWHATDPHIAEIDWVNNDGIWPMIVEDGYLTGEVHDCERGRRITGEVEIVDVAPDATISADGSWWAITAHDWRTYQEAAR